jgi:hypothetical protein
VPDHGDTNHVEAHFVVSGSGTMRIDDEEGRYKPPPWG